MVKRCSIFDMGRLKDVYREFGWPSENYRKEERMEKVKEVWEIFCENAATVATWSSEEATLHLSTLTSRAVALGRIVGILSISSMVSWLSLYNALLCLSHLISRHCNRHLMVLVPCWQLPSIKSCGVIRSLRCTGLDIPKAVDRKLLPWRCLLVLQVAIQRKGILLRMDGKGKSLAAER